MEWLGKITGSIAIFLASLFGGAHSVTPAPVATSTGPEVVTSTSSTPHVPTKAEIEAEISSKKIQFAKLPLLDPAAETLRAQILTLQAQIGTSAHPSATIDQTTLKIARVGGSTTVKGTATDTNGLVTFFLADTYTGTTNFRDVAKGYNSSNKTVMIYGSYPESASNGYWSAYMNTFSSDTSPAYTKIVVYDFLTHALLASGTITVQPATIDSNTSSEEPLAFNPETLKPTSDRTPTFSGTVKGFPSVSVRLLGPGNEWHQGPTVATTNGAWSITLTESLAPGVYGIFLYGQPYGSLLETDTVTINP
jgi:hypothetical protein